MKKGDIVKLRSGGPNMTVANIYAGQAICQWFVDTEVKSAAFPEAALESV